MIFPSKHMRLEESILGLGSVVLSVLHKEMTFDDLWAEYSQVLTERGLGAAVDVGLFLLTIDWLFMIGSIDLTTDLLLHTCA